MKAQKAKKDGNEGQSERNEGQKKAKWKEMKAQKSQNERKWRYKRPKWKEMETQKCQNERKESPKKTKMKGNEGPKGQNERKWRPKRPKWKEMKAQKAKMKGNKRTWKPKRQKRTEMKAKVKGNAGKRKWRPKRPKWKEKKAQKAKMKGNESPKGQNERKWRPKRPKWKEMKGPKGKNKRKPKAYKSSCVGRISGASPKSLCGISKPDIHVLRRLSSSKEDFHWREKGQPISGGWKGSQVPVGYWTCFMRRPRGRPGDLVAEFGAWKARSKETSLVAKRRGLKGPFWEVPFWKVFFGPFLRPPFLEDCEDQSFHHHLANHLTVKVLDTRAKVTWLDLIRALRSAVSPRCGCSI